MEKMLYTPALFRDPDKLRAVMNLRHQWKTPHEIKQKTGIAVANALVRCREIVRDQDEGPGRGDRGYTVAEAELVRRFLEIWDRYGGRQPRTPMSHRAVEQARQIIDADPRQIERDIAHVANGKGGRNAKFTQSEVEAVQSEFRDEHGGDMAKLPHMAAEWGCSEALLTRVLNGTYRPRAG